ncbi:myogenesis-regulating glycosidase-like isoform X2 [Anneissia japonica]|uniref:myogenesis-regulating glycosidase-like isoform X2 n=1 Tax=Anneissia japonica TaxID=1529436 RepID=UPI0014256147|nr:myogenesis-regulating glycosidase-like isoform X2 [Anneissia japonica]
MAAIDKEDQEITLEGTSQNDAKEKKPEKVSEKELKKRTQSIVDPAHVDIAFPIKQLRFRRENKLKVLMVLLFFVIISGVVCIYIFFEPENLYFDIGETRFELRSHRFVVQYTNRTVLTGNLGQNIPKDVKPFYCRNSKTEICLRWMDIGSLTIQQNLIGSTEIYEVTWVAWKQGLELTDCYSFGDYSWYGGAILPDQSWPIQYWNKSQFIPFITAASSGNYGYGSLQDRYWLSSSGVAITVNRTTPLFVNIVNNSQICFKSVFSNPYTQMPSNPLELQYSIIVDKSISSVQKFAKSTIFPQPKTVRESLFGTVIWSLEDLIHGDCLTQNDVLNFADDIESHGYNANILEIPEGFASKYGDFNFDPQRFPNPSEMFQVLHDKGWKIILVIGILVNTNSDAFIEGVSNEFWVKEPQGLVPGLVQWDYGIGALLDVTNDNAVLWFVNRLNNFRTNFNIDYFSFKYGQASYLPFGFKTKLPLTNPSDFTQMYVESMQQVDGSLATTSSYQNQDLDLHFQLEPANSTWLPTNGLKSVIPSVLNLAVLGYPYFIPSSIGGSQNVQKNCSQSDLMFDNNTELYIRWLGLQAFFPIMKFSVPPWKLDDNIDSIAKKWVKFHEDVVKNKYIDQVGSSEEPLTLIQPLWLTEDLKGIESDVIETTFMIGNSTVVAPILNAGETSRKVYLPKGTWTFSLGSGLMPGGKMITIRDITIDSIAYFELTSDNKD